MQRAILEIKRIRTQLELDKFRIKQRLIYEAMGIEHHLELDELKSGGWVVDVWIDQRLVDSGEYFMKMVLSIPNMEACLQQYDRECAELDAADVEAKLGTDDAVEAQAMVAKFFNLKNYG